MASRFLKHWHHRVNHWYTMFAGTSYYHVRQGLGRAFVPGELKGYFNDLTGKADWKGKLDQNGLPFNTLTTGQTVYFPVVLCQKALGHWDRWLLLGQESDRNHFLKIAEWVKSSQDSMGGWDTWGPLGQPPQYRYSAMTQGEAISVLVRAHQLTSSSSFEKACRAAVSLMRRSVPEGGVCCYEGNDVFLEEYPALRRDTVLNGWIFALFGVRDFWLRFPDQEVKAFYQRTCASLVRSLPAFDAGFWSYYSSGTRRLASPFYHDLHLNQLQALKQVTEDPALGSTLGTWTDYANQGVCRWRALMLKGFQKLREPCEITIVD